jgi:hypothetical protein
MMDLAALLGREHDQLDAGLRALTDPTSPESLRDVIDGLRLGLAAHVEAESHVLRTALGRVLTSEHANELVAGVAAAHAEQERLLATLVAMRPWTQAWRDRARELRQVIDHHALDERARLVPALRSVLPSPVYQSLAGWYATERLRLLQMMYPVLLADAQLSVALAAN